MTTTDAATSRASAARHEAAPAAAPSGARRPPAAHRPRRPGADPALTLVSAPAGFGKTTLVADWFADDDTTAWLSLDPGDDDPTRFWTYVVAALERGRPRRSAPRRVRSSRTPAPPIEAVVATLINDLETAATDLVLVLDDYHVIESAEIHDSVAFLLEHLPPQVRLVIATRADPPLPLASMRARGDLLEVRAADLRFTAEEAAEYLNEAMDLHARPPHDVDVLEARTEGWIAALQLAALSMQGRVDPAAFIAEFAGDDRFILDYLADEVLERQTPRRPGLPARHVDPGPPHRAAVRRGDRRRGTPGRPSKRSTGRTCSSSPLDDRRTWYRYHHLFGDVLRARLLDEHPDRVPRAAPARERLVRSQRRARRRRSCTPGRRRPGARGGADRTGRARDAPGPPGGDPAELARGAARPTSSSTGRCSPSSSSAPACRPATRPASRPLLERPSRWLDADRSHRSCSTRRSTPVCPRTWPCTGPPSRSSPATPTGHPWATPTAVLDLVDGRRPRSNAAPPRRCSGWPTGPGRSRHGATTATPSRSPASSAGGHLPDLMGCSLALADIQLTQGQLRDAQRTFESALATHRRPPRAPRRRRHARRAGRLAIERNDLEAAAEHLAGERGPRRAHGPARSTPTAGASPSARLRTGRGRPRCRARLLDEAEPLYNTDFSPRCDRSPP